MVFESCSETAIMFATIGMIAVYLLIGGLVACLVSSLLKRTGEDDGSLVVVSVLLWPAVVVAGVIYVVGMWILYPFFGATKEYVDRSESRTNRRIDKECSTCVDVADSLDIFDGAAPFKRGDVVTGVVPQTDKEGNNISYKCLYQGCKCRVLSIESNGSMEVILIGHKDKEAHAHKIGDVFTAPARNFTKVKKTAKKRKVAKKVAKKKTRR